MSLNQRFNNPGSFSLSAMDSPLQESQRRVLRNTYTLLAMSLAFSGAIAYISAIMRWPYPGTLLTLIGYFGLLFAVSKCRNSGAGVALVFALTGFMGYTLGPIIGLFLGYAAGMQILLMATGGTAIIFFAMSAIALTSKRDFSFMGNFLAIGAIVAFLAGLAAVFFNMPILSLAVSAAFLLISSGFILYETNAIVRGGETNYVMATVALYVQIYNLFVSLLNILSALNGRN
jgi:modulator of FtsH protease